MSFNHYRSSRCSQRDRRDSWPCRERTRDRPREVSPYRKSHRDRSSAWDTRDDWRDRDFRDRDYDSWQRDREREYVDSYRDRDREYDWQGVRDTVGRSPRSPRDFRRLSDSSGMSDSRVELAASTQPSRRHSSHDAPASDTASRARVSQFVAAATSIAAKINAGLMARDLAYRKQQTESARRMEEEEDSRNDDSSSSSASKMSMGGCTDTSGYDSPAPRRPQMKMVPRCVKSPSPEKEVVVAPVSAPTAEAEPTHYTRDVDINGFRSKHLLTKSSTQAEIQATTGCSVTSRGRFMDKGEIAGDEKPLHLHLAGPTTESIAAAVKKIQSILHQDMYDDHRNPTGFYRNVAVVNNSGLTPFQLRGLVVGPRGQNIKHIQQASGCRIQIKGIGSRYMEGEVEEQVPLYVNVSGHDEASVDIAEHLIMDLMRVVESSAHKRYRMSKR
ncbi:hypothetical protein CJU90_0900 [Yarrowia sp. C11]|nr:hypothetical protein CKK34_2312 [Yarrowia sp. E02]KAG5373216.1 hypothetical protein CJU90_0900 [Yarrowia sp. C11]